jgi:predicted  nucleic acid-binding Zn-ribbon protein
MKRLLTLGFAALIAVSCQNEEQSAEVQRLADENEALMKQLNQKDSTLFLFEESFSAIQENLSMISEREKSIQLSSGDLKSGEDAREEITKDIQAINTLLADNKNTIARLNKSLAKYGQESAVFKKLIDQLNADIESKEEEVSYLKENLTAANFTIEILNEMLDSAEFRNEIQGDMIRMQSESMNTAYYAIGSFKDLQENEVLTKEGGVIGLGTTKNLKDNFNKDYFVQIDITKTLSIPLNAKKVEVASVHATDSYELQGEDEKTLLIKNPTKFWEATKYLVVVTK